MGILKCQSCRQNTGAGYVVLTKSDGTELRYWVCLKCSREN